MAIVSQALCQYLAAQGYPQVGNDWLPEDPDTLIALIQPGGDQPHLTIGVDPYSAAEVDVQLWVRGGVKDYDGPFATIDKVHQLLANLVELAATVDYLATAGLAYDLLLTLRTQNGPAVLERDTKERVVFLATYNVTVQLTRRTS